MSDANSSQTWEPYTEEISTMSMVRAVGRARTLAEIRSRWPLYFRVAFDLRDYVWPAILVLGTLGNLASAIVYSQPAMRQSTSALYFRMLSLTEMAFLLLSLVPSLADRHFDDETIEAYNWTCQLWNFITFTLRNSASWILVLLSLERLVCVLVPHKVKLWVTKRKVMVSLGCVYVLMAAVNTPFFVMIESSYKKSTDSFLCIISGPNDGWRHFGSFVWPWVDFLVYSLAPLVLMSIANIGIIVLLANARRHHAETSSIAQRKTSSMTVSLVAVCMTYLVLSLPLCVRYLLNLPPGFLRDGLLFMAQTCSYLNHSVNFFLYCLAGSRFRQELVRMFSCRKVPSKFSQSNETLSSANI